MNCSCEETVDVWGDAFLETSASTTAGGFGDELLEEADERQTHLKHMVCRQIKESTVMLKRVKYADDVLLNYELKYKKVSYKKKKKKYNR